MALKDITLGQYFPGHSFVHKLDPRTKLLAVVLYIVALFLAKSFVTYGILFVLLAVSITISKVPLKSIVRGLKPVVFIVIFTAILNLFYTPGEHVLAKLWIFTITLEGVFNALFMVVRILMLIAGTFLLTYVVLVFTFGVSLLLLETALGRKTGQSAIGAFKAFGKKYAFIGILASAVPFIITPYYCIIGGWVTKYTAAYLVNGPEALADGGDFFTGFITSNAESYIWMLVFMAIVFVIVGLGVKGGIEKANLFMMPALIIMAVAIAIYTLTMPGAVEGALYYLTPDFSKFSPELVIGALGQMFYSLSLAMGIMITYGSYMRKQDSLTSSVVRIGGFDLGVSFIAGLLIVSAAFVAMGSGDAVAAKAGPSLMFVTLPTVFVDMGGMATFIGFLFFLLVLFAALTSAISLVETLVSIVHDGLQCTRAKALGIVIAFVVIAGAIINAGYNGLSFIEPLPRSSISRTSSPTRCSCPSWPCSPACSSAGS